MWSWIDDVLDEVFRNETTLQLDEFISNRKSDLIDQFTKQKRQFYGSKMVLFSIKWRIIYSKRILCKKKTQTFLWNDNDFDYQKLFFSFCSIDVWLPSDREKSSMVQKKILAYKNNNGTWGNFHSSFDFIKIYWCFN